VQSLREVHAADGYPSRWPEDPAAWLAPSRLAEAWVATDPSSRNGRRADDADGCPIGSIAGHIGAVVGVDEPMFTDATRRPPAQLVKASMLFVTPSARGRGVAVELMAAFTDYAHRHELCPVLDVVEDGTSAIKLYERLGWRLAGRQAAEWTDAEGRHPTVRVYVGPTRA
jgi:GNAT superfamily N-acetyltransferase